MNHYIWQLVLYFFCYSVIGWFVLTGIRSIQNRRLVNVGMLDGPVCPSIGGALTLCVWLVSNTRENYLWQYLLCVFITLAVFSMEKTFARRYVGAGQQDLMAQIFKVFGKYDVIAGYLVMGLIGFCVSSMFHPILLILVNLLHPMVLFVLDLVLIGIFVIDMITSGLILQRFRNKDSKLQREITLGLDEARLTLAKRFVHMLYRRIIHAYPEMALSDANVQEVKGADEDNSDIPAGTQEKMTIDRIGSTSAFRVFAPGVGFMKIFWVFLICALVGDLVETVYCGLVDGVWMSRSSFLYGPLSIVWGGGSALGVAILKPLQEKNDRWVFFGGFLLGGAYEYLCSVFTELVFGQVFWDYSDYPLNIGGRTNVLFMFFWGIAALVLMKFLYPLLSRYIEKIRPLPGLLLTWILMIVLILDLAITGLALGRYSFRESHPNAKSEITTYLDTHYPDEVIEKRWQNMRKT